MFAMARLTTPDGCPGKKTNEAGAGMLIPIPTASRSIR
jgi:hypothetical protein